MFRRIGSIASVRVVSLRSVVHVFSGPTLEDELRKGAPMVIDFYADWCGPCMSFAPRFEELSNAHPDVRFVKLNVDTFDDVAANLAIRSVPTFVFLDKSGAEVNRVEGAAEPLIASALKQFQHK